MGATRSRDWPELDPSGPNSRRGLPSQRGVIVQASSNSSLPEACPSEVHRILACQQCTLPSCHRRHKGCDCTGFVQLKLTRSLPVRSSSHLCVPTVHVAILPSAACTASNEG